MKMLVNSCISEVDRIGMKESRKSCAVVSYVTTFPSNSLLATCCDSKLPSLVCIVPETVDNKDKAQSHRH